MTLLREAIGERLRRTRTTQRRTLREVARDARVSLGYLSEVERGRKEASSELLASICEALELPLDELLRRVAGDLGPVYLPEMPDTVPELVAQSIGQDGMSRRPEPEGGCLVGPAAGRAVDSQRGRQAELRLAMPQAASTTPRAMVGAAA